MADGNADRAWSKEEKGNFGSGMEKDPNAGQAWANIKSGLGFGGNPQKDALARRQNRQAQETTQAEE